MKKIKYIILTVFILTFFISCKKDDKPTTTPSEVPTKLESLKDLENVILYSMENTYLVTTKSSIKDGSTEVYKLERTITITDNETMSGSTVTNYYNLNSSFTLEKSIKVDYFENLNSKELFGLQIDESYFASSSINSSSVTLVIKKDKTTECFNDDSVVSSSDINVNMTIIDYKITDLTYNYTLDNKTISSVTSYKYL